MNVNWNLFKNVFLGLFGVAVIALLFTVAAAFDDGLKDDIYSYVYMSVTWSAYIGCKICSEYNSHEKNN